MGPLAKHPSVQTRYAQTKLAVDVWNSINCVISTNSQTTTDVFTRGMEKGGFCRNSPE